MLPPPLPPPDKKPITTEDLLNEATSALKTCADFLNTLNGRVSYQVWCDAYASHQAIAEFQKASKAKRAEEEKNLKT